MIEPVAFIKPRLPEPASLVKDIERIYNNNYYSNNGPVYHEFREGLETYLGQGLHAVVVSSATQGLMLAMYAVFGESTPQKRYIAVPSFTFSAGPLAIKWCGFEPIFFDVDSNTTQPSIPSFQQVLEQYGEQIAGVLLINNFGIGNADINEWEKMLVAKQIPCVIDSAPGLGSTYSDNTLIGGKASCEVFSLHATKPFGIGEGGLITTKDLKLAERLESLKNFGFNEKNQTTGMGMNAKITELDCAIGLHILSDYHIRLKDRRNTYKSYEKIFSKGSDRISFLPRAATSAIQFASILVPPSRRQQVLKALSDEKIEARTYYAPAVHTFPFFHRCSKVDLSNTEKLSASIISLPVHSHMPIETVDRICSIILSKLINES